MDPVKTTAPDKWSAYSGLEGVTQFVSLREVIGVKFPDEATGGVTLRLTNGQFVNLDPIVSLVDVLGDLNALCCL